jgi:hypothetical protein
MSADRDETNSSSALSMERRNRLSTENSAGSFIWAASANMASSARSSVQIFSARSASRRATSAGGRPGIRESPASREV